MKVRIETISHDSQRYETVGDWYWEGEDTLVILVSELFSWREEMAVAFHELFEALVCKHRGISEKDITAFDEKFEARRAQGKETEDAEPGMDVLAPYRQEHQMATGVELILATELDIIWSEYDKKVSMLKQTPKLIEEKE